jgi:hypothetical protein
MTAGPLHDLPGSAADGGTGPAVFEIFEALLDDAGDLPAHREHLQAWYGASVGPLLVPAVGAETWVESLLPDDHALRVLLVAGDGDAETGRQVVRAARDLLAGDDRVELVGVRVALPGGQTTLPGGQTPEAARALLAALDFTVPAWIELTPAAGWSEVLPVIAADGAEHVSLRLDGHPVEQVAALLRAAVDLDLAFRLAGPGRHLISTPFRDRGYGWLNVLCAVRAALNGAEEGALADVLLGTDPAPLTSALRRMSEADAAVTRAFLVGVQTGDVAGTVDELTDLGLIGRGA